MCRVECEAEHLVNPSTTAHILQNVELRRSDQHREAVQLKPQHVQLELRVNQAYEMDFHYEQVDNRFYRTH